jgi:hypothetical protein
VKTVICRKDGPQGLSISSDLGLSEQIVGYQQDERACQQERCRVHCVKYDEEEGGESSIEWSYLVFESGKWWRSAGSDIPKSSLVSAFHDYIYLSASLALPSN